MIRHIVLVKWKPGATEQEKKRMIDGTHRLGKSIPKVVSMTSGVGLDWIAGSFDFGMVADFKNHEDWLDYREHPEHERFVREAFSVVGEIARLQIDTSIETAQ